MKTNRNCGFGKAFLLLICLFSIASCATITMPVDTADGWTINIFGVNAEWIKKRQWPLIIIGAASSFGAHELAHVLVDQDQGGWHGRAGFVAQAAAGTILNVLPWTSGSDFSIGFNALSFGEVITYPVRRQNGGDLDIIDNHGGNADMEYGIYSIVGTGNVFYSIKKPFDR